MKSKSEKVRMVTRSYAGISVFKNGSENSMEKSIFFPNMSMSQVSAISAGLNLDMSTAKEDIRKYSLPESEFLKLATME